MSKAKSGIDYTPRLTNGESKKQGGSLNPSKSSTQNKLTSNLNNNNNQQAVPGAGSNGTYPGFARNSTGNYTNNGGTQYGSPNQSQQYNSKQQQFQGQQINTMQLNQQSSQNASPSQHQNYHTLENQNTLEFDDQNYQNLQTGNSQTNMISNNSQLGKSELFTQNYRVSNTYRPISTLNFNQAGQEKNYDNSHLKKAPNQLKVKLNKSSKSETPLKPGHKDQSINQQQQQSNFNAANQQNGLYMASTLSTKSNQANVNIPFIPPNNNGDTSSTPTGTSPQSNNFGQQNNNQDQQTQSNTELQNNSNVMNQQGSSSASMGGNSSHIGSNTQYSRYSGQLRYDSTGLRYGTTHSQHNQNNAQFGMQYSQRVLSPKTEPSEYIANLTSQNFYQNMNANNTYKQRSPFKYNTNITPNTATLNLAQQGSNLTGLKYGLSQYNYTPYSYNSENIQQTTNANNSSNTGNLQNKNTSQGSQSTLAIKQNPPHSNNLNDLGLVRKSQTPKKVSSSNNNNVSNNNDKKGISPARKNVGSQQNSDVFQFSNQHIQKSSTSGQQQQQPKNQCTDQPSSPNKHKKSTSEIDANNIQKDPSEMFLIRDQDTGQVYDIRQIDKIDTFQKTNNQEYFDKLKKRHKNAWQGWWNSKKENNIKMIQSVRQNSFSIVEQLLQHERADLRADTDFKDQNQWSSIHYAANNGNSSILNLLISHDSDINITNNLEQTPLMIGADKGFEEIVEICIKAGADINRQDLNQNTALHFACKSNSVQCVKVLLVCKQIDVNLKNVEGKLAIESTKNMEIVNLFAQFGKDNGLAQQIQNNMMSSQNTIMSNSQHSNHMSNSAHNTHMSNSAHNTHMSNSLNHNNNMSNSAHNTDEQYNSQKGKKRHMVNHLSEDSTAQHPLSQNILASNSNFNTTPNQTGFPQNKNQNQTMRSTPYEQILNQSALSGFYGQKLTFSSNYGQGGSLNNQNKQSNQSQYNPSQNNQQDNQKRSFEVTKQYSNSGVLSSSTNNNNNNRSSNSKSGGTMYGLEGSPNKAHTQSISSQESSQNSQNQFTDSQIQNNSSNQPWKVIIHDFPDENIMKMFNNSPRKEQSNNSSNGNFNNQIGQNNQNSNSQYQNNLNTQFSTNETITNNSGTYNNYINVEQTLSPSQKHHKIHSQDVSQQNNKQNQSQNQMQQNPQLYDQQQMSQKVGPQDFRIVNQIGRGSFGEVYLVEKKGSDQLYAMKMLHKSKVLGQNLTKYAMTERNVLSIMSHPFIVKLMYAFQTSKDLFLIMEFMPGGDLSHALQRDKRFSEQRARIYLSEIMLAIKYLHKHDIIYRDLKPENIVIDGEGHAMLTDFGLSKDGIFDHYSTHSFCGSLAYLAPEMLKRCGHGKAVDYYHLGVLLFEMLTGSPPFFSESKDEICHNIEFQDIRFPSHVSDHARNLISRLLVKNPQKRLGFGKNDFEEMKKHPFFNGLNWNHVLQRKLKPPPPFIKPVVESRNSVAPNFMMTMTPLGMTTDNHISGWSFINNMDHMNNNNNNNNTNNFNNNIQINQNNNNNYNNNNNNNNNNGRNTVKF